eukprot:gene9627-14943_t
MSSRSHCIFTISVEQKQPGSAVVRRSKLHLVDLAGSERVKKTGAEGKLLQEARYINLSLHYLQEVITALCDKADGKRDHIPYRQSLMTMVLRDSLGGNCKTVMLATAHPQDAWMDETVSTCKFAQRVASIKVNARINEETDPTLLVKKLKAENAALKEELAMYRKGDQAGDRILSSEEKDRCKDAVVRYVNAGEDDGNLTGLDGDLARIFESFRVMRQMILAKGGAVDSRTQSPASTVSEPLNGKPADPPLSRPHDSQHKVSQLQLQLQQKESETNMLLGIIQKYQAKKSTVACQTGDSDARPPSVEEGARAYSPVSYDQKARPGASQQDQVKMVAMQHKLASDYNLDTLDAHGLGLFKDTTRAFEEFRKSWRKFEQVERQKNEQAQRCEQARNLATT